MGKFFDALTKSEKLESSKSPASEPKKITKVSSEQIDDMRLESRQSQEPLSTLAALSPKVDPRLICSSESNSIAAESFKLLRAKIFCRDLVCRGRTIMVTSGQPLDGKSIVAANLAVSIAQGMDGSALLIDCDLRQPTQHLLFDLKTRRGLREYLEDGTSVSDYFQRISAGKLTLLPAGGSPSKPAELLSSEKMRRLLDELKDRHHDRCIILDTAPAGFASETLFLSSLVDEVLLVVRSGKTEKETLEQAVENIGREKIIGVVFNASDKIEKNYRYYQRYYKTGK